MMTRSRKADLLLAQDLEQAAAPEAEGDTPATSTQAVQGPEASGADEARQMAASTEDTADSFRSTQGDDIDSEGGLQGASTCSEMSIDEPQDPANQLQGCGPHQDDSGVSSGLVHAAAPSDGSGGSTPPTFPAVTPGAGDAQLARSEASGDALPNISSTPEGSQDSRRDLADSQPPSLDGSGTDSGGASSPRRALAQVLTGAAAHDGTTDDAHVAASS